MLPTGEGFGVGSVVALTGLRLARVLNATLAGRGIEPVAP